MKIKYFRLKVGNTNRRVIVDMRFAAKLTVHNWKWVPKMERARASVKAGKPRIFLHRYVSILAGRRWAEVFFLNNDPYDCRLINLAPYRREEEGARRKNFKNKKTPYRGVYPRKNGKWGAVIRHRRKLKHLGTFLTAEIAAQAYLDAWKLAHPGSPLPFQI